MNNCLLNNPFALMFNANSHPNGFRSYAGTAYECCDPGKPAQNGHLKFIVLPYAQNFIPNSIIAIEPKTIEGAIHLKDLTFEGTKKPLITLQSRFSKSQYLEKITALKKHIQLGDIYEINFCMDFFAEDVEIDPLETYQVLNAISEAPFSAFIKLNDTYIICSSPERFLKKENGRLITQPIKGTARRGTTEAEDLLLKENLSSSLKEKTENVMIVDVARNDLSKIATKGSVQVDELFGIHSYKQVHQMVSTVSCAPRPGTSFEEILAATFPMPSMTGAPKQRASDLIKQYEGAERGFYSGCIGYIDEHGDFDLNVVIRSIVYDAAAKKVSFHVGSAITAMCDAEAEYDECMVKAGAMLKALNAVIAGD